MSKTLKQIHSLLFACVLMLFSSIPGWAAGATLDVQLWDRGAPAGMMNRFGMNMGMGSNLPMAGVSGMGPMGIDATPDSVPAGEVTFNVKNTSSDMIHEMVVAPIADTTKPLPYNEPLEKVDEDAAGQLGEVEELEPGTTGTLTLTLKAGTYMLYCNLPGHYASGMWTLIKVE